MTTWRAKWVTEDTQCEKLLALLKSKPIVGLPEILDLHIASHTRRISDLRKQGYDIICHDEYVDGQRHTKYELRGQRQLFQGAA